MHSFRLSFSNHLPGAQSVGIAHAVRPQQLRNRNAAPFRQVQSHERVDNRVGTIAKDGSSTGRDRVHADAGGRTQRVDQNLAVPKGPSRNRAQIQQRGVGRISHGQGNNPGQGAPMKVGRVVDVVRSPVIFLPQIKCRGCSSRTPCSRYASVAGFLKAARGVYGARGATHSGFASQVCRRWPFTATNRIVVGDGTRWCNFT